MKVDVPERVCFCLLEFTQDGSLAHWGCRLGLPSLQSDWTCLKRSGSLERGKGRVINNDLVCVELFTVYKARRRDQGLTAVSSADGEGPDGCCGVEGDRR